MSTLERLGYQLDGSIVSHQPSDGWATGIDSRI
jgi:hypothetical protein